MPTCLSLHEAKSGSDVTFGVCSVHPENTSRNRERPCDHIHPGRNVVCAVRGRHQGGGGYPPSLEPARHDLRPAGSATRLLSQSC